MFYTPEKSRSENMHYRRCGQSGVLLPAISLGLWHDFGGVDPFENCHAMLRRALDLGITHFDLANNYGPPPGSAEETFGRILKTDFAGYRDELIVSTKAGYTMWGRPLWRLGLAQISAGQPRSEPQTHRPRVLRHFLLAPPRPRNPARRNHGRPRRCRRAGKALYAGVSNYPPEATARRCPASRTGYALPDSSAQVFDAGANSGNGGSVRCAQPGRGGVHRFHAFGARAAEQPLLRRYSRRLARGEAAWIPERQDIDARRLGQVRALNEVARKRGQSLAQMALAWVLRQPAVTSALIGASRVGQLEENVAALEKLDFAAEELALIDTILRP